MAKSPIRNIYKAKQIVTGKTVYGWHYSTNTFNGRCMLYEHFGTNNIVCCAAYVVDPESITRILPCMPISQTAYSNLEGE